MAVNVGQRFHQLLQEETFFRAFNFSFTVLRDSAVELFALLTFFISFYYFDIFFPTDFERLRDMYEHILTEPTPLDGWESRVTPLSPSVSPLSVGADFFSSYRPTNRRAPVDGVTSSSGLPIGERKSSIFTHAEFLETYADLERTQLKNGENPMMEFYQNVKFLF